jgi:uncharacterized integral membrane protein
MRSFASILVSVVVALWVSAIAILSVQNFTPVSLRLLNFQSIEIPFGLVLAFSAGIGMVGVAITRPLLGFSELEDDE